MYIEVCLSKSVEIKNQNAFSLIIPAHISLHSPHKALLSFFLVRVILWLAVFDFLLFSQSVAFLFVSLCIHMPACISNGKKLQLYPFVFILYWTSSYRYCSALDLICICGGGSCFLTLRQNKEFIYFIHIKRQSLVFPSTVHHQVTYGNRNSYLLHGEPKGLGLDSLGSSKTFKYLF